MMSGNDEKRDQLAPEIRFRGFSGEWEEKNLEDITCKIGSGKTPKGGESNYVFEGIPLIRSQNIYNNLVDLKDVAYVTIKTHEEMQNSCVSKNDVLLNITGASIGRSAVYRLDHDANVNQHVCIIRLVEGYNSGFVQLHLSSSKGQNQIDNNQAGGAREGLNFRQIGRMYFKFPTIDEQTQIDNFFRQIDRLISQHQQKHDKLLNIKKALLEKMFPRSGKTEPEIRFKGFSGEWEEKELREIGNLKNGMNFDKNAMGHGYPFVNLQDVFGKNVVSDKNLGLAQSTEKQRKEYSLQEGDVLFIRSSVKPEGVGETAVISRDLEDTTYSGFIIRFRPSIEMSVDFNRFFYSIPNIRKQILASATSSANTNINQESLQRLQLVLPTQKEQTKIGNFFQQLDRLISQHQTQIQKLNHLKQAFLSKMFV